MSTKSTETREEIQKVNSVSANQGESVYTPKEFAENAEELFGTSPECVAAALKQAGITECTKARAAEIVKEFRGRRIG